MQEVRTAMAAVLGPRHGSTMWCPKGQCLAGTSSSNLMFDLTAAVLITITGIAGVAHLPQARSERRHRIGAAQRQGTLCQQGMH